MGQRHTLPKVQKATVVKQSSKPPSKTSYLRRFRGAFGRRNSDHWDGSYCPHPKSWKFNGEESKLNNEEPEDEYALPDKNRFVTEEAVFQSVQSVFQSEELPLADGIPKTRSWHSDQVCDYNSGIPFAAEDGSTGNYQKLTDNYSLFSEAMWNMLESKQKKWQDETNQLIRKCDDASERKLELWKEIHKILGDKKDMQKAATHFTKDIVALRHRVDHLEQALESKRRMLKEIQIDPVCPSCNLLHVLTAVNFDESMNEKFLPF